MIRILTREIVKVQRLGQVRTSCCVFVLICKCFYLSQDFWCMARRASTPQMVTRCRAPNVAFAVTVTVFDLVTSHKYRCMPHRHSVFHWPNMSRNQSRTIGSAWILRRFTVLPLGSSSTSAAAGVAEDVRAARAAQGALVWAISSCVSGRAIVSPGRHQELMVWGCTPAEHVPRAAASWGVRRTAAV